METGDSIKLQPNQFKETYRNSIEAYFKEIQLKCADYKIDFMPADINGSYHDVLLKYLLKRQKLV